MDPREATDAGGSRAMLDVAPQLLPDGRLWRVSGRSDPIVNGLADRHYPRRSIGCGTVGGPGKVVVLRSIDHLAGWITLYTVHPDDGLDAWRNTMFRNEGEALSSALILDAMGITAELWGACPPDGWVTYIDTAKVRRKRDPGRCYLRAGWYRDLTYKPDRRRASLNPAAPRREPRCLIPQQRETRRASTARRQPPARGAR